MKKVKSIMLQGTASSVGKSVLTAALCRIFHQDGYRVVPFKSQNMALNSYITEEGLEMGRAQVFQAEAAKVKPSVKMNPILLKPTGEAYAQVVVMGKVYKNMTAVEYHEYKPQLRDLIGEVYKKLGEDQDIVVIEGAGSPAEINLRDRDIVNMGMAEIADAPVILIGDIDRGGVFASLYGTLMLLSEEERRRVKGVIINKFRGDKKILEPGLKMLEELIGIPVLGVIPYSDLHIEDEDSVTERFKGVYPDEGKIKIDVIRLPHISNFTDFHMLEGLPDVRLRYISRCGEIDEPDILILPGTKSTMADLQFLTKSGLDQEIIQAYEKGSIVFGICGGYQMLGNKVEDPLGVESQLGAIQGLGLLDVETYFEGEKVTTQVEGRILCGGELLPYMKNMPQVKGYEIHMGRTTLGEGARPFIHITKRLEEQVNMDDGAMDKSGRVFGTYIHGIFDEVSFTGPLIEELLRKKGLEKGQGIYRKIEDRKNDEYDKLADIVRGSIDLEKIYAILGEKA